MEDRIEAYLRILSVTMDRQIEKLELLNKEILRIVEERDEARMRIDEMEDRIRVLESFKNKFISHMQVVRFDETMMPRIEENNEDLDEI